MSETAMFPRPPRRPPRAGSSKESVGSVGRCRTRWSDGCVRISLRLVRGTKFRSLVASGGLGATHRQREYSFGVDPFSYATVGRYWANHAWLSDTGMYLVHRSLGAVRWSLSSRRRSSRIHRQRHVLDATCSPNLVADEFILLAILAMTPRTAPSTLGHLVLHAGICLGCLHAGGRWFRAVPILIVLWVNLDSWFVLGPLLVVLFWARRQLDYSRAAEPLAGLAGPRLIAGLPLQSTSRLWIRRCHWNYLRPFGAALPWTRGTRMSSYRRGTGPLLAKPGLQFGVAVVRDLDRTRFSFLRAELEGAPILALSGLDRVRGPGLLAGAVGSLLCRCGRTDHRALNLGELVPERAFRRPGRAAPLIAASLALVALAWLGWTVGFHNRERGAGWAIHTDATLARAATGIAEWREKSGIPPDRHVFTTHVDLGHYLAWFAPNEKSTLDSRLQLFGYDDYGSLSHELGLLPADEQPRETLKQIVDQKQIAAVALVRSRPASSGTGP